MPYSAAAYLTAYRPAATDVGPDGSARGHKVLALLDFCQSKVGAARRTSARISRINEVRSTGNCWC